MALAAGSRIGLYEIVAPLGAGGMGEVYRARDTRLNRDVAVKILPEALAGDPDRLARFEREAQALAALNHPNIAGVYAVEGLAIVMELVSGEDLSARIGRGPIPLAEALPLARQIADAIDAAHEAGIIHRDLKPANIKVKDDGTVKVLDFGLAKALEPPGEPSAEAMNSPTLTNRGTRMGVILGTAAYMAPEQARGKVVDKRADIWAFGVVLYEMLTGVRPFAGDNVTDLLAAVVRAEPDWNALPARTPPLVRRLLQRCLAKEPKRRLHDIADARLDLDDAGAESIPPVGPGSSSRWIGPVFGFVLGVAITATAFWLTTRAESPAAPVPITTSLIQVTPADEIGGDHGLPTRLRFALSPNGRTLVFSAVLDEHRTLYMRNLDELQAKPITGTEDGDLPFFSPDGEWIAYWAKGQLWKVRSAGGPSISVCALDAVPFGATWAADDQIVFAPSKRSEGLWQVSSSGGKAERLTKVDASRGETGHRLPAALPRSGAILFTIRRGDRSPWDQAEIAIYSTQTHTYRVVVTGGADARYVATGSQEFLVFVRDGVLMAAPFDVATSAVTAEARPVGNVMQAAYATLFGDDSGAGEFSVSDTGTLVYIPWRRVPGTRRCTRPGRPDWPGKGPQPAAAHALRTAPVMERPASGGGVERP
jgi:serine/threonine-protein kinase